jgi:hypothetical protein
MLNALLSLPAVAGESFRSLDATPFSPLDVTSPLNSLPLPDPTRPTLCGSGPIFSRFNLGFGDERYRIRTKE